MDDEKRYRDITETLMSPVMSSLPFTGSETDFNQRTLAIAETLSKIPSPDYEKLGEYGNIIFWCLPTEGLLGEMFHFEVLSYEEGEDDEGQSNQSPIEAQQLGIILHLPSELEQEPEEVAVAVIAHLLAHVYLQHSFPPMDVSHYHQQEDEVQELLTKWGFDQEVEGLEKVTRWRNVI